MARPQTISNERLLEVAREVFSEQGFSATTLQIARRAGISEGTLFKRFATKEQLFEEAIGLGDVPRFWATLRSLVGQGEVRANLEGLCLKFLEIARLVLPRLMIVWSRGSQPLPQQHRPEPFERDLRALGDYLQAEAEAGRLRPLDSQAVASALLGSLFSYAIRELHRPGEPPGDERRFVTGLLDALWHGLKPPGEAAPGENRQAGPDQD